MSGTLHDDLRQFIQLTAVRNVLNLDNGAVSMAILNGLTLLIATLSLTTIQTERFVVFEQKHSLREQAIILHQMNRSSILYITVGCLTQNMLCHTYFAYLVILIIFRVYYCSHINYINPIQSEQRSLFSGTVAGASFSPLPSCVEFKNGWCYI